MIDNDIREDIQKTQLATFECVKKVYDYVALILADRS